jgi:lysophospholipase L1-like esterase
VIAGQWNGGRLYFTYGADHASSVSDRHASPVTSNRIAERRGEPANVAGSGHVGQIIAGYKQLITQAHAAGLKIFGGTLTPFKGASYWSPEKEHTREVVNRWIRTSGAFDGVIDFAKAIADPSDPEMFYPPYDSGDHLHPNDAGYQAMANAVDLGMLLRPTPQPPVIGYLPSHH